MQFWTVQNSTIRDLYLSSNLHEKVICIHNGFLFILFEKALFAAHHQLCMIYEWLLFQRFKPSLRLIIRLCILSVWLLFQRFILAHMCYLFLCLIIARVWPTSTNTVHGIADLINSILTGEIISTIFLTPISWQSTTHGTNKVCYKSSIPWLQVCCW